MSPFRPALQSVFALVFSVSSAVAVAQSANPGQTSGDQANHRHGDVAMTSGAAAERDFAKEAAIGGMMEVEAGRIALQKTSDPQVRQFAQRMVDDHSKANEELKVAASQAGITLPTQLDGKHKADLDKLNKLSGADFDAAYKKMMLEDHRTDVALFEKAAGWGQGSSRSTTSGRTSTGEDASPQVTPGGTTSGSGPTSSSGRTTTGEDASPQVTPGRMASGQSSNTGSAPTSSSGRTSTGEDPRGQAGQAGPISQFASKTLPTLREHLRMAEALAGSGSGTTGSR